MSEMIDRVAEAICIAENGDNRPNGCRACLMDNALGNAITPRLCATYYGDHARGAMWAMREPTSAMLAAANFAYDESPMAAFADSEEAMAEAIRAMIDEALK